MKIGFIGLGKMGSRMALKLLGDHEVVVWNRNSEAISNFKFQIPNSQTKNKVLFADTIEDLISKLDKPKIVWVMVPQAAVEGVLTEVRKFVKPGDIVIDGGNSFYKDTERRFEEFEKDGVRYLGIGVSGGILAAENGYPMMVGGNVSAYQYITTILDSLSKPSGGHEYFGTGGAGHFVKMVHNGIEYGMMQSLGEGFDVLANSKYKFDLSKVAKLWQKGTIVSGFLVDRAKDALEKDPNLENLTGEIDASGEAEWTVNTAKEEGLEVEIIEQSLEFRRRSKTDPKIQNSFTAKMVAALRREFGGHEVKKKL